MIRITAAEGVIHFRQHDQSAAMWKPDTYMPGASVYDADQDAGQFFYQVFTHERYTIYKNTFLPAQDLTLRVEYPQSYVGIRIVVKNHIHYHLNKKRFHVLQGQVNIVSVPSVVSEYQLLKGQLYQLFDLQIAPGMLMEVNGSDPGVQRLLDTRDAHLTKVLLDGPGFGNVQVLDAMEALLRDPGNEQLAKELTSQAVAARMAKRSHRPVTEKQVESLFRVKDMIKEQIAARHRLRDWAKAAGMNITYFKEMFKAVFGVTPYHYLIYERIREAKRMMQYYPHLTLSEVAEACGFSNYNNLRRAFASVERITLSQWQRLSDITGIMLLLDFLA